MKKTQNKKTKKEKLVIEIKENKNTVEYIRTANRNHLWLMTTPPKNDKMRAAQKKYYKNLKDNQEAIIEKYNLDRELLPEVEPDYLKLYIRDITSIFAIPKSAEKVFHAIIKAGFVDIRGVVELTSDKKKHLNIKILKSKDESSSGFNKALIELQRPIPDLGNVPVFIPLPLNDYDAPGIERYKVNELVLGNGSWLNIRERRLRVIMDYDPKFGRAVKIEELDNNTPSILDTSFLDKNKPEYSQNNSIEEEDFDYFDGPV